MGDSDRKWKLAMSHLQRPNILSFYLLKPQRHSVDQCTGEQVKNRVTRVTPAALRGSPRGLNLQTLQLKGAADTTVKILLQRKHQRGELHKISS